jgi:RsiW-degrading membrane proteinase PrsW (M82 family)
MAIIMVSCISIAPSIREFKGLFHYLLYVWALLAPPVFVCVLFGLYYRRANARGALTTLIIGCILGVFAFFTLSSGNPALLIDKDFAESASLVSKLQNPVDSVSKHLRAGLSEETVELFESSAGDEDLRKELYAGLAGDVNAQIESDTLYDPGRFAGINVSGEIVSKLTQDKPEGHRLALLNRRLLEAAYPNEILAAQPGTLQRIYAASPKYLQNKLNVSFVITIICAVIMYMVSHLTTYTEEDKRRADYVQQSKNVMPMTREQTIKYRVFTGGLLVLWVAVMLFFSPLGIARQSADTSEVDEVPVIESAQVD